MREGERRLAQVGVVESGRTDRHVAALLGGAVAQVRLETVGEVLGFEQGRAQALEFDAREQARCGVYRKPVGHRPQGE